MTKQYSIFPAMSLLAASLLFACGKYQELADASYPDQVLYMPTAGTLYHITRSPDTSPDTWQVPTPGNPYRFRIDEGANKVIIPLGAVRGGINNAGSVMINITNRPDTVNTLIDDAALTAQLLPQSAYTLPSSVTLADGKGAVTFDVVIDRAFLLSNLGQSYAIGVRISSEDRQTNPDKETTIVVFDTNLLIDNL